MPFEVQKKKAVLVPSGNGLHLFVILTDACQKSMHLLVPLCSIKPGKFYDNTCIVTVGEHPFVKHDSYVSYKDIQERQTQRIVQCIEGKSFIEREDVSDPLYNKICLGIEKSFHTPRWAKKQYKDWPQ